jgi:phosphoenolpyruvate carboxykinase (ATP)
MKKSIFGVMNYLLPARDVLPMHCSANVGADGVTALFFGLSGTGKTTLSADPTRRLIGDDEHGWSPNGVFNFEGGCYAKCVDLSEEKSRRSFTPSASAPSSKTWSSIPPPASPTTPTSHSRKTPAPPIPLISLRTPSSPAGRPSSQHLFLAADAFGVLPPIARLTPEQAMYHFLSGYTAKLAGTEAGLGSEPVPEFSACFGSPFLPLAPRVYAEMLGARLKQHQANCWLVNTGWSGGKFGVGKRMSLRHTRALVNAALDGQLDKVDYITEPAFGLNIPVSCPGVPSEILNPRNMWSDKAAYDRQATSLAAQFESNFRQFNASEQVSAAGPKKD